MPRVLPSVVALTIFFGPALAATAATVNLVSPRITWVSRQDVKRACSSTRPVAACTTLQNPTLTCDCIRAGTRWRRRVHVSAEPEMFLTSATLMLHEMGHVADFRGMLRQYARTVESRTFATATECEAAARRVRAGFDDEMMSIRDESARRRDGTAVAETTSPTIRRQSIADNVDSRSKGDDRSGCGPAPSDGDLGLEPFVANARCP